MSDIISILSNIITADINNVVEDRPTGAIRLAKKPNGEYVLQQKVITYKDFTPIKVYWENTTTVILES